MRIERRGDASREPEAPHEEEKKGGSPRKREISVIIYTTVLFVVALALILLSYQIQQRANNTITDITEQHGEVTAQALRNIEELQKQNQTLSRELDEARDGLEDAQRELEDLNARLEEAEEEKRGLSAQINELNIMLEELEKRAQAAGTLLELVANRDPERAEELLREMSRLSQYLDEAGTEIYNAYINDRNKENTNKMEG